MKIKKFNEEGLTEGMNNVEAMKYHVTQLKNLNFYIDVELINNNSRIKIKHKGFPLIDVNNNDLGIQTLNTFLMGMKFGIEYGKDM